MRRLITQAPFLINPTALTDLIGLESQSAIRGATSNVDLREWSFPSKSWIIVVNSFMLSEPGAGLDSGCGYPETLESIRINF